MCCQTHFVHCSVFSWPWFSVWSSWSRKITCSLYSYRLKRGSFHLEICGRFTAGPSCHGTPPVSSPHVYAMAPVPRLSCGYGGRKHYGALRFSVMRACWVMVVGGWTYPDKESHRLATCSDSPLSYCQRAGFRDRGLWCSWGCQGLGNTAGCVRELMLHWINFGSG